MVLQRIYLYFFVFAIKSNEEKRLWSQSELQRGQRSDALHMLTLLSGIDSFQLQTFEAKLRCAITFVSASLGLDKYPPLHLIT